MSSVYTKDNQIPDPDNQGGFPPRPSISLDTFINSKRALSAEDWCSRFESLLPTIANREELNEAINAFQGNCRSSGGLVSSELAEKMTSLLSQALALGDQISLNPIKVTNANVCKVSQESDTSHLFPYKLGTPPSLGGPLAGATPDKVADSFRTLAEQALCEEELDPQRERVKKYLNNEVGFVRAVVEFYERLKTTANPVVLWDVDDTLGCTVRVQSSEPRKWRFRLSAQPLFSFLMEQYPDVQNGILTSRGYKILPLRMDHLDVLSCLDQVFNGELIFSARDLSDYLHKLDREDRRKIVENALPSHFNEIDCGGLDPGALTKLVALYRLMQIYPENTLHLVDNLHIPVPPTWQHRVLSSAVAEAVWCDEYGLCMVKS